MPTAFLLFLIIIMITLGCKTSVTLRHGNRWAEWASTYCRPAGGAILMIDIIFRGDYLFCVFRGLVTWY